MRNGVKGFNWGIFVSVVLTFMCQSYARGTETFVETCLESTGALSKTLVCTAGDVKVSLASGTSFSIGARSLPVKKIQHLPMRISDTGFMDESIKFVATQGAYFISLEIPCGQSAYAYVSVVTHPKLAPYENVMECH